MLLLVRSVPRDHEDWRDAVRIGASDALDNMLRNVGVQVIQQVNEHDREKLFTLTAEKFVSLRNISGAGGDSGVPELPDLSREGFDKALMVVIAGYLAVHHRDGGVPTTQARLLGELLRHEQHYWSKQWKRAGLEQHFQLWHSVAFAGLGSKFRSTFALSRLRSRTMVIEMVPTTPPESYRPRSHDRTADLLRAGLSDWAKRNAHRITEERPRRTGRHLGPQHRRQV